MIRSVVLAFALWAGAAQAQDDSAAAALAAAARLEVAAQMLGEASGGRDRIAALTETVRA